MSTFRLLAGIATSLVLAGCSGLSLFPKTGAGGPRGTRVVVHAVTHDAKLIGTAVGGVRITIRDATGRVMAEGIHEGSTGDTKRIMQDVRARTDTLFAAAGGARYETTLMLDGPTMVEVTAEGPLNYVDQMARSSKRLLLLPGRDVGGDGIVLELHGYVIDLLSPDTTLVATGNVAVKARVRMLCSCPTQPRGMWEVEQLTARLMRGTEVVATAAMSYAGEQSTYSVELPVPGGGADAIEILASSPRSATFGYLRRRLTAR